MSIWKTEKRTEFIEDRETNPNWRVVREQINKSQISRLPWKMMLGETLTNAITKLRSEGHGANGTLIILHDRLLTKGFNNEDVFEKLKISVSARYGEQKSAENIK